MASKFASCSQSTSALKDLLLAKGIINTVYYSDGQYLVFSVPFCSRVFRLRINSSNDSYFGFWFGDAWTSGITVTNLTTLVDINPTSYKLAWNAIWITYDSDFLAIYVKHDAPNIEQFCYIGVMPNNKVLAFAVTGYNYDVAYQTCRCYEVNNKVQWTPIPIYMPLGIQDVNGNLYSFPLHWVDNFGKIIIDGSAPAETKGLKQSTARTSGSFLGENYFLTTSTWYGFAGRLFYTNFLLEFTP